MSSRRHFAMAAAAVAAGLAITPCAAYASSASHSAAHVHLPALTSANPLVKGKAGSPAFKTFSSPAAKSVRPGAAKGTATSDPSLSVGLNAEDETARSVQLTVTVTAGSGFSGTVEINWGDGSSTPASFGSGTSTQNLNHTYQAPGGFTVTATATDNASDVVTNSFYVVTAGNDYTSFGPTRLLDTRNGTGGPVGQIPQNGTAEVQIAGASDGTDKIPDDVTAVVVNITVTDTHGTGFVTASADGDPNPPTASNVNYVAGQTVPNLAIVPVGADGEIDLTNEGGLAGGIDVIADVTGYFTASNAAGYTSLSPDRLVDTRNGTGASRAPVGQNGNIAVQIAGQDGGQLPSTGISAVALNVTVTDTRGNGFLTVFPDGKPLPTASNVNYSNGQTIANSVIVPVGSDGRIDITDSGAQTQGTDVIVDVTGYYSSGSGSAYIPVEPSRYLDTRSWGDGPLDNGDDNYIPLPIADDENGNPIPGDTSVVMNATVTNTQGNGFLTFAPDPNSYADYINGTANEPAPPNSSSLNWTKNATVPNLVQADTGQNGIVDVWNLGVPAGSTDLIIDIFGVYQDN